MVRNDAWCWNKELPHKTCQKLIKLGEEKWEQAKTFASAKGKISDDIRKSDVVWIRDQWVYDLIWPWMVTANEEAGWKYDIIAAADCQLTRYTKDGFYIWHKDGMGSHYEVHDEPDNKFLHGNVRKLSMSIILNDEYEGGDFEIIGLKEPLPRLEKGTIIVFPSFIEHRVIPVTKGTRYSLVAWFVGPPIV